MSRAAFSFKIKSFWFNHFVKCCIKDCTNHRDHWGHHIVHQAQGGPWEEWNKLPLCREHHTQIHAIGEERFMQKYPGTRVKIEKAWRIWEERKND